jgi:hypothetical protein
MDQIVSALQFLVQQRSYLIAAAVLAAIVFVLRVMGAATEIQLKYIMPIYLVGGFSALVLAIQIHPSIQGVLDRRERARVSLASLSLQHRAFLTYMKAQGHRSFTTTNYATLRELIPLGLLLSSDPRDSNAAPIVTFTVPRRVWKAIHDPAWQGSPLPTSPPWDPAWIYDNLIRR